MFEMGPNFEKLNEKNKLGGKGRGDKPGFKGLLSLNRSEKVHSIWYVLSPKFDWFLSLVAIL